MFGATLIVALIASLAAPAWADMSADIAAADAAFAAGLGEVTPDQAASLWQELHGKFCVGERCRHDAAPHSRAWLVLMVRHISEAMERAVVAGGETNEWLAGQYETALMKATEISAASADPFLDDIDMADALFARDMPDIPPVRTGTTWAALQAWCQSPDLCRVDVIPRTHAALIAAVHRITLAVKDEIARQRQGRLEAPRDLVLERAAEYVWVLKLAVKKGGFADQDEAREPRR